MRRASLREGIAAENDGDEVEKAFCSDCVSRGPAEERGGRRTLDLGEKRREILAELLESGVQSGTEAESEHEVEELVHVLGESLADGLSEHADALED